MDKSCVIAEGCKGKTGYIYQYRTHGEVLAHRIAWADTHGKIPKGYHIRHLCHNKACIEITHLALGTAKENMADMIEAGRYNRGEKHGSAVISERSARQIKNRRGKVSKKQLAEDYEVSERTIESIWYGENWKWL